jgi:hypothetical protein
LTAQTGFADRGDSNSPYRPSIILSVGFAAPLPTSFVAAFAKNPRPS